MCYYHFVCPHSAHFSRACGITRVHVYKYVPVIVFSSVWVYKACVCAPVNACVQRSVCNYSDGQGNCTPSPTTKRILILSGLTVPPDERGGGEAISFPWRTTRVDCLAFCSQLWWKRGERKAEKPWGCRRLLKDGKMWKKEIRMGRKRKGSASASCNRSHSPS